MLYMLILFLIRCIWNIAGSKSTNIPPVFYISYSESNSLKSSFGSYINESSNITDQIYDSLPLSLLLRSDDSPFQPISLPWSFNFFGKDLETLYANPNGALHISMKQPCQSCSCFGNYIGCNFNVSYYGLIAGFLTDLYPYGSNASTKNITITRVKGYIENYQTLNHFNQIGYTDSFFLNFVNIRGYSSKKLNNTFSIQLLQDSSIIINYFNFSIMKNIEFITGLRVPNNYLKNQFLITEDQIDIGITQWSTNISGIYPSLFSDLAIGNRFVACPLSTYWCLINSSLFFPISKPDSLNITLELSTISLSCTNNVKYYIYMNDIISYSNESSVKSTDEVYLCKSTVPNKLFCNISKWIGEITVTSPYTVYVDIYWSYQSVATAERLSITSIPLYLYVDKVLYSGSPYLSGECSENVEIIGCSKCDICHSNYTCLDLPCSNTNSQELIDETTVVLETAIDPLSGYQSEISMSNTNEFIYDYVVCNNSCSSEFLYNSNLSYPTEKCCLESDMDCNGQCYGPAVTSINTAGAAVCCLSGHTVDCTGVCDGPAKRDACGTCQGTDFSGIGCKSLVTITTEWFDNNLYPNISLLTGNFSTTVFVNVTNGNDSSIAVTFSFTRKDNSNNGPDVSFPIGSYIVPPYQEVIYGINISYYHLISGKQPNWEVKELQVSYIFITNPDFAFNRIIYIYPSSYGCNIIENFYQCMRLPTCLFCLDNYPAIRLLTDSIDNEDSNMRSYVEMRRLYANIIPNGYQSPDINPFELPGSCIDSNFQTTCDISSGNTLSNFNLMLCIFVIITSITLYLL